jgi:hypothetical protein
MSFEVHAVKLISNIYHRQRDFGYFVLAIFIQKSYADHWVFPRE